MVGKFLYNTSEAYVPQREGKYSAHYLKLYSTRSNQLLETIYTICKLIEDKDIIRPHNLLVCGPDTTENQIVVLFKRAKSFIDAYLMIGVNNLTFKLQEVSLNKIYLHNLTLVHIGAHEAVEKSPLLFK